jgi:lysophospholipase L1-like esterase
MFRLRLRTSGIILIALLALVLPGFTGSAPVQVDTSADADSLLPEDTYPEDIDLLEEVIQSYYLLLESESYTGQYSMLHQDSNILENDKGTLTSFYKKLTELRNGKRDRVSILQIGDSHIQPGYFSGTARSALQSYFGNAGRGLVFPWRLAGTNQPDDIRITSTSIWRRSQTEIGISGYGLSAAQTGNLTIQTNNFFQKDNTFDQVTLILKEKENSYVWNITGREDELSTEESAFARQSVCQLSWLSPVSRAELTFKAENNADNLNLYGLILERQQPGLLYHSMGINGASFERMSRIAEFFPQIRILNPDLIIVSLGTNDVQGHFRSEEYLKGVKQFMKPLRKYVPGVPVLFTLPPDSYKNGVINSDLDKAAFLLKKYALDNRCAWWDLREVMGGAGSVSKWRSLGLAAADRKHYTPKGYMLQGHLFQQALLKGYKQYAEQN